MEYLKLKDVTKILGVSAATIYRYVKEGKIEYITLPSGLRRYKISNILVPSNQVIQDEKEDERYGIIYSRVSTRKQADDLERQEQYLRKLYPKYISIKDYGSGINYKRKGLITVVERVLQRRVKEVVVAYRDRLCRFGFELLEQIFKQYKTTIVVLNNKECSKEEELVEDILSIITVFSCRVHGLRKYKSEIKRECGEKEELQ